MNVLKNMEESASRFLNLPYLLFAKSICKIRSSYYSRKIDTGGGKITVHAPFVDIKIKKHKNAFIHIKGNLNTMSHIGNKNPIHIELEENSTLKIDGDFLMGQGVRIFLKNNSTLTIGGKDKESGSGISGDTLIMAYKEIHIGKDFLCAWNVFISDSDWHQIKGQNHQADIFIGDHVWIANNNNILKGSNIGNNCIVASNSKTIDSDFPDNALIGGIPAKLLTQNIDWNRDIDKV